MSIEQYLVPAKKENICANCAYPIAKCLWLHEGKPVPGWTAEKSYVLTGNVKTRGQKRKLEPTWHITACPNQIPYPAERHRQDNTDEARRSVRTFY